MSDLVFIQQYAPHGAINGQEVLDACLMGSAFGNCALIFLGDGLYQLVKKQDTSALGVKDYSVSYGALSDYGVSKICCLASDLEARALRQEDLTIEVEAINDEELRGLIGGASQVLTF